jgi:uncharacterized RDD family membrane protein YckC
MAAGRLESDLGFGYRVRTPENVTFEFELVGLGTRFLAWLIDGFVLAVGCVFIILVTSQFAALLGGFAIAVMMIEIFGWTWGYHIYLEYSKGGMTVGKRALGIHVISEDGLPIDFWQALVRNLLRIVDFLSPVYLLGGSIALGNRRYQRLGDLVAGTLVVRKRQSVRPSEVIAPNERYNMMLEDQLLAARVRRGIRAEEKELLISLCLRRNELELDARGDLFRAAAAILRERFEISSDTSLSDERIVLNVTAVLLGVGGGAAGTQTSPKTVL